MKNCHPERSEAESKDLHFSHNAQVSRYAFCSNHAKLHLERNRFISAIKLLGCPIHRGSFIVAMSGNAQSQTRRHSERSEEPPHFVLHPSTHVISTFFAQHTLTARHLDRSLSKAKANGEIPVSKDVILPPLLPSFVIPEGNLRFALESPKL